MNISVQECGCAKRPRSIRITGTSSTGADQQVLPPDSRRVGLFVSAYNEPAAVAFGQLMTGISQGLIVRQENSPYYIDGAVVGDMIKQSVHLFAVAGHDFSFTEVIE